MKSEKGITLVALVVTIVLMLILLGVTINLTIGVGLFDQTKDTADKMQIDADRDLLASAVTKSIGSNARVDINKLRTNAEGIGFTITGSAFPYTCTSENGSVFIVAANGNIAEYGESEENIGNTNTNTNTDEDENEDLNENNGNSNNFMINVVGVEQYTYYNPNGTISSSEGELINYFNGLLNNSSAMSYVDSNILSFYSSEFNWLMTQLDLNDSIISEITYVLYQADSYLESRGINSEDALAAEWDELLSIINNTSLYSHGIQVVRATN